MRLFHFFSFFLLLAVADLSATSVCITDATNKETIPLIESHVNVTVENQVAVVHTRQLFRNNSDDTLDFKYAFPMPADANATDLEWTINGEHGIAKITKGAQDSTLPGSGSGGYIHKYIEKFLGDAPLFFDVKEKLQPDSTFEIELTYVQLLNYELGKVQFSYPWNYMLIQKKSINKQSFSFTLNSQRKIDSCDIKTISDETINITDNQAVCSFEKSEAPLDDDIFLEYQLNSEEFGLFGFSTYQDTVPDQFGRGFFLFAVEPDASQNTQTLHKNFVFVIDESGSMGDPMGSGGRRKIYDAKETALFIIDNINQGDRFNIVSFDNKIKPLSPELMDYNTSNKDKAKQFINDLVADGSTNISGALEESLTNFTAPDENFVNIILFFTDGLPSGGIEDPIKLNQHVDALNGEKKVHIFPFGVGTNVNKQLLGLLADNNNGTATFLGDKEIKPVISKFYMTIKNPVVINSKLSFDPNVVNEVYPGKLPNLYKGSQMLVAGRYSENVDTVDISLTGIAYSGDVNYDYKLPFAETQQQKYRFLPKIWAKLKIEDLLHEYYTYNENDPAAIALKDSITNISIQYGLIVEFTSFEKDDENTSVEYDVGVVEKNSLKIHPNPSQYETKIGLNLDKNIFGNYKIKILNSAGQLVRILNIELNGKGYYEVKWDGLGRNGNKVSTGEYFIIINLHDKIFTGKIMRI